MNILRRASTRQLLIAVVAVIVIAAGSAVAFAGGGGGPTAAARAARRGAARRLAAPKPVRASPRASSSPNHLIPSGSLGSAARRSSPAPPAASGPATARSGSSCSPTPATRDRLRRLEGHGLRRLVQHGVHAARARATARHAGDRPHHAVPTRRARSRTASPSSRSTSTSPAPCRPTSPGSRATRVRVSPKHSGGLLGSVAARLGCRPRRAAAGRGLRRTAAPRRCSRSR